MISPGAIRLLNLGPTAWARTQSVYQATAELLPAGTPGAVIFAQSLHPYLSHGVQQFASETFDLAACERLGLPVVRRPFPGDAEYCDAHHLLFQWVLSSAANGQAQRSIAAAVVSALGELGVLADFDGAAQFNVKGARLGTLAGGRLEPATVLLGCLYFAYDPGPLAQTLCEPRLEHVTSLWAEAPRPLSPEIVQAVLLTHFAGALGRSIERDTPRVPETRAARKIEQSLLGVELEELPPEETELAGH